MKLQDKTIRNRMLVHKDRTEEICLYVKKLRDEQELKIEERYDIRNVKKEF